MAGPRIQHALWISPVEWGWVTGVFTVGYAIFEIPSGVWGDRLGPRRVLTRIVLWWSVFTSLTGAVSTLYPLLWIRFLFGAGEAGAYPNASVVIARWFPIRERGRAFGVVLMAAQIGGAFAPLLVIPIQIHFGWRMSFYVFACLGVAWSAVWYGWFRDSPAEKSGVSREEIDDTRDMVASAGHRFPWRTALGSLNFWTVMGVAFCYVYTFYFYQSWFHTYLVKGRGYDEQNLLLSSLPFLVGASANVAGGMLTSALVKRIGLRWGRCSVGVASLAVSAIGMAAVLHTEGRIPAMILLSAAYAGITLQQPIMFAVCLDIGGRYAGAMVGAMNTASQLGSFVSSLAFGYLVEQHGSYDAPLIPMVALLAVGSVLWLKVDPREQLLQR